MNFKNRESTEKLRGGYYTPLPIAEFLSSWALNGGARRVLEPSCGDGVFFQAIERLAPHGSWGSGLIIDAVEILPSEVEKAEIAAKGLLTCGAKVSVHETDFFDWISKQPNDTSWDAIIGNPPYIRYQYFETPQRDLAAKIFGAANVPFSKRTNAWVPFVIASIMHLSPGGRLAMVLPAEILHIMHANGLRLLLEQEMKSISIVDVREMVFDGVLQGVVLLRAEKRSGRKFLPLRFDPSKIKKQLPLLSPGEKPAALRIQPLRHIDELESVAEINGRNRAAGKPFGGKWTQALLEPKELKLLHKIEAAAWSVPFVDVADVDIGIVTGANNFFVVNVGTAERYELTKFTSPMLARSEFMEGIIYTPDDQRRNEKDGKPVLFVEFPAQPKDKLSAKVREYLQLGEAEEIHTRFKCRIREPWYVVPYIWVAELSLLKRCHRFPRIVLNEARAYSTDTAYRIVMKDEYRSRAKDLVFSFLNSLTFLCAELEGRHYGGGVLELVPSEIEQLLLSLASPTDKQFSVVDEMVRRGVPDEELLDYTDPLILGPGTPANLAWKEIQILRTARNRLLHRRLRG